MSKPAAMILETSRLRLRPMRLADAASLHALMSDARVMAFWDIAEVQDIELTTAILKSQLRQMTQKRAIYWAMETRAENRFIGCCDLAEIDRWHHRAEVGFMVARPYWGDGYTQEAMWAVIDHAAQAQRLKRLTARTHLGNVRSVRLLRRLGFQQEGLLRGYVDREGERRDCLLFGLLL
ncbi:MAG: GNAT family N-acetyltransferase [Caulobacteraceae bacterium]|nr:GNAT family N-acetyltransferase [Caulobacteraceae bacterium]